MHSQWASYTVVPYSKVYGNLHADLTASFDEIHETILWNSTIAGRKATLIIIMKLFEYGYLYRTDWKLSRPEVLYFFFFCLVSSFMTSRQDTVPPLSI